MHIGREIASRLEAQERSQAWLARKLNCDRSNVYKIVRRPTLDTGLLLRISRAMDFNIFALYDLTTAPDEAEEGGTPS